MDNKEKKIDQQLAHHINYYQRLFSERGYNESGLNNGAPPGSLAENIDVVFRQLVAFPKEGEDSAVALLQAVGIVGERQEVAVFSFSFEYSRPAEMIRLVLFQTETFDGLLRLPVKNGSDFPALEEVIEAIKAARVNKLKEADTKQKKPKGRRL